jgi:hypothetical protein
MYLRVSPCHDDKFSRGTNTRLEEKRGEVGGGRREMSRREKGLLHDIIDVLSQDIE